MMETQGYARRIKAGQHVKLSNYDPADKGGTSRDKAEAQLAELHKVLAELQELIYAAGANSVLIVLQGIDTAGKDGTVSHVMSALNPAACRVESFKTPTAEELAHDFLWRIHRVAPALGTIAIFNRSQYEDVLVARVHDLVSREVWEGRYEDINNFERLLADNGTIILKFCLYISKQEQADRLTAREQDKTKAWKLSASDWPEHERYDDYIEVYQDALTQCSTDDAPWYVVPADHKWFRNLAVAEAIVTALEPYRPLWEHDVVQRGEANLAAIAAAQPAPAAGRTGKDGKAKGKGKDKDKSPTS